MRHLDDSHKTSNLRRNETPNDLLAEHQEVGGLPNIANHHESS